MLLTEIHDHIGILTLNRIEKHNAFNNELIILLQKTLEAYIKDPQVRIIMLRANGQHFSAGADLNWMQEMIHFTANENKQDALILAKLLYTLNSCPKPTLAVVQGSAFGGGAGLATACDITIAADDAHFCFSEVKLGLIPAVISPYVVQAVGARIAKWLFMSAEIFSAETALRINFIQHLVALGDLEAFSLNYANKLLKNAPQAVVEAKQLIHHVQSHPINEELLEYTAELIAQKRVSAEAQKGLQAFINKHHVDWDN